MTDDAAKSSVLLESVESANTGMEKDRAGSEDYRRRVTVGEVGE